MKVAPSLLSADFLHLSDEIARVESGKPDFLHLDIMDGRFVPNISFGFPVVEALPKATRLPLDVHLMIVEPEKYVERFARCGAAVVNVHYEACTHLHRTVCQIRELGCRAGVTLNPHTPVCLLHDILPYVDIVQLMSVNPGFGGQKFIPQILEKTSLLKKEILERNLQVEIEIDGGVNRETAPLLRDAGADILVAGSAVFKAQDPKAEIEWLKTL